MLRYSLKTVDDVSTVMSHEHELHYHFALAVGGSQDSSLVSEGSDNRIPLNWQIWQSSNISPFLLDPLTHDAPLFGAFFHLWFFFDCWNHWRLSRNGTAGGS